MTRVPVDWNHINKPPYPLLGGNMKKVGGYSVIQSSFTVSHCAICSNLGCLDLRATETVLAKQKGKKKNLPGVIPRKKIAVIAYITLVSKCQHILVKFNLVSN